MILYGSHTGLFKTKERNLQFRVLMKFKQWAHRRVELQSCWLSARRRAAMKNIRQVFASWCEGVESFGDEKQAITVGPDTQGSESALCVLEPASATPLKLSVRRQYPASPAEAETQAIQHGDRQVSQLETTTQDVEGILRVLADAMMLKVEHVKREMKMLEAAHADTSTDNQVLYHSSYCSSYHPSSYYCSYLCTTPLDSRF